MCNGSYSASQVTTAISRNRNRTPTARFQPRRRRLRVRQQQQHQSGTRTSKPATPPQPPASTTKMTTTTTRKRRMPCLEKTTDGTLLGGNDDDYDTAMSGAAMPLYNLCVESCGGMPLELPLPVSIQQLYYQWNYPCRRKRRRTAVQQQQGAVLLLLLPRNGIIILIISRPLRFIATTQPLRLPAPVRDFQTFVSPLRFSTSRNRPTTKGSATLAMAATTTTMPKRSVATKLLWD